MNQKYYLIIPAYLFFISCNYSGSNQILSQNQDDETFEIVVNESQNFAWPSDLVVDDVVYLQTNKETLISKLGKLVISPDRSRYIVVDKQLKKILIFDQLGNNIKVFDKKGPAPDEYLHFRDVHINFQTETIEILEYRNIQVYSLQTFEHLKTISLLNIKGDINYNNLASIDTIYYLWTPITANQRLDLIEMSEYNKYHLIKKDGDDIEYFTQYQHGVVLDDKFYPSNVDGEFNISPILGSNTIYRLTKDGMFPKISFPFASNNPPQEDLENYIGNEVEFGYSKYFKHISNIRETNQHIYFTYTGNGVGYHLLFDSKNKKIISTGKLKDFRVQMIASDSKYFYCSISPNVYQKLKNEGSSFDNHPLLKHVDTSKFESEDNPIIIKFHIPVDTEN
ncbi:6-bladed beta-propeller [Belliella sp. DSM 107340]|uniref:6-bladed beta-propeller n=1 Tax=Belliella calami TaxID=2923436 RepID=A0ABS9UMM8_9BACT|nr:6-bladed beta-propeller [Belliella calami]MCH7397859.1 6-bladed beta-propeller [Belliella calami]